MNKFYPFILNIACNLDIEFIESLKLVKKERGLTIGGFQLTTTPKNLLAQST